VATHLFAVYPLTCWLLPGYVGEIPTALAYGLFVLGMRSTPSTVASVLTLVEPLTATLVAWALFGERLGAIGLLGAWLLIGAICLLAYGQRR
jgi:DME family drug/metabolite transporter